MEFWRVNEAMICGWIGIWLYIMITLDLVCEIIGRPGDPWIKEIGIFLAPIITGFLFLDVRSIYQTPVYLGWKKSKNFRLHGKCSQAVSIDEIMKKFKGQSHHRVYEPSKPAKRGLKWDFRIKPAELV